MPDLDPGHALGDAARSLERTPTAPDPVEALAQTSGVSVEALRSLPAEERGGLASLEASVAHAVEASQQPGSGVTPEMATALTGARDQVRADVTARVAAPEAASPKASNSAMEADDARIRIRDSTITIESRIHIYGSGASQQVADLFERQIRADWGQNTDTGQPWTFTDHFSGREYNVRLDVDVDIYDSSNPTRVPRVIPGQFDPFNRDNYIEVISRADAASRATSKGPWRSHVSGGDEGIWQGAKTGERTVQGDRTVSHEFGHTLAFLDRYEDKRVGDINPNAADPERTVSVALEGWEGNLMASLGGKVEQRNIDALVREYVERSRSAVPGETRSYGINDSRSHR